jgi:hypothetical protein
MAALTIEQQIAHLVKMAGTGVLESEQADGKRVKFADITELKARIAFLRSELTSPPGTVRVTRTTFANFRQD